MPSDAKHELVSIQRPFKVETASKEHFSVLLVPHLEDAGWLLALFIFSFDFLTCFHRCLASFSSEKSEDRTA
jgi:hypothetical protein